MNEKSKLLTKHQIGIKGKKRESNFNLSSAIKKVINLDRWSSCIYLAGSQNDWEKHDHFDAMENCLIKDSLTLKIESQ